MIFMRPLHVHDCDEGCTYLGSDRQYDFYFHEDQNTVLARYGSNGSEYYSANLTYLHGPSASAPIKEAINRLEQHRESESMTEAARASGEAQEDPDDGYYYSGTGEWSGDDSYISYLNNN